VTRPRLTASGDVEPTVWDALIGGLFGLLLIYAAGYIPYRIPGWLVLLLGWLFVVVMFPAALVMIWPRFSGHVWPSVSRMRGDVRADPRVGRLTRDRRSKSWEATFQRGDRAVTILIAGTDEPDPRLVAAARDLVARFDALEPEVMAFVASEAEAFAAEDPEMADEARALRISSLKFWYPERPDHVLIDFTGPDEDLCWSCEYVEGELSGLEYDS
jgi:hypothetical protein